MGSFARSSSSDSTQHAVPDDCITSPNCCARKSADADAAGELGVCGAAGDECDSLGGTAGTDGKVD